MLSSIDFYYASERFEPVKIFKKRNPDIPLFYGISGLFVTFIVTHLQLVEAKSFEPVSENFEMAIYSHLSCF